jgi:hypothetical protein
MFLGSSTLVLAVGMTLAFVFTSSLALTFMLAISGTLAFVLTFGVTLALMLTSSLALAFVLSVSGTLTFVFTSGLALAFVLSVSVLAFVLRRSGFLGVATGPAVLTTCGEFLTRGGIGLHSIRIVT